VEDIKYPRWKGKTDSEPTTLHARVQAIVSMEDQASKLAHGAKLPSTWAFVETHIDCAAGTHFLKALAINADPDTEAEDKGEHLVVLLPANSLWGEHYFFSL
jgi:hypothetical protein